MDHLDFGRWLIQQRELRGMSREQVAIATKIPATIITALETGQVERLPGRVFVLNYLRAYAQVVGMQPEDAVLRYEEIDKTLQTAPPPAVLERQRRKKALLQLAVLIVAVGAGAALIHHFASMQ